MCYKHEETIAEKHCVAIALQSLACASMICSPFFRLALLLRSGSDSTASGTLQQKTYSHNLQRLRKHSRGAKLVDCLPLTRGGGGLQSKQSPPYLPFLAHNCTRSYFPRVNGPECSGRPLCGLWLSPSCATAEDIQACVLICTGRRALPFGS